MDDEKTLFLGSILTGMDFITLLLLALGLCFDTFAVSVSCGLVMNRIIFMQAVRIALMMAVFQGMTPLIGWLAGSSIARYITSFDHWLAFGLLFVIGARMIYESFKHQEKENFNPLNPGTLVGLSLATSIDALVVGVSLAFVRVNIYFAVIVIASVTFIASMLGILFGKKTGERFSKKLEIAGGLAIILIGIKILLQHLLPS